MMRERATSARWWQGKRGGGVRGDNESSTTVSRLATSPAGGGRNNRGTVVSIFSPRQHVWERATRAAPQIHVLCRQKQRQRGRATALHSTSKRANSICPGTLPIRAVPKKNKRLPNLLPSCVPFQQQAALLRLGFVGERVPKTLQPKRVPASV